MMIDFEKNIDEFLDGLLSGEDQIVFRKELETNSKLEDEVKFHQQIRNGIEVYGLNQFVNTTRKVEDELDQAGFFADQDEQEILGSIEKLAGSEFANLVSGVDQELEKDSFYEKTESAQRKQVGKIRSLSQGRRRLIAIAATLTILIGASISLWPTKDNATDIYNRHFVIAADLISSEVTAEKSEIGFAGDNTSLESLEEAMKQYQDKSYTEFSESMKPILNDNSLGHYKDRMLLLLGTANMEIGDYKNAIKYLTDCNLPEAIGYLMLAHLANGDTYKAKQIFETQSVPSEISKEINRSLK